ncbi:Ig-like domain-containing protein [Chitinophagales bacterium]|nr:Ig-like domain-containing protein [Chitinophagales bacterium]
MNFKFYSWGSDSPIPVYLLCFLLSIASFSNSLFAEGTAEVAPNGSITIDGDNTTDVAALYINADAYSNFAAWNGSDVNSRLHINLQNPNAECIYLGFSQPHLNNNNQSYVEGEFRILDPGGNVVFGPQALTESSANIETWAEAVNGPIGAGGTGYTPIVVNSADLTQSGWGTAGDFYIEFRRTDGGPDSDRAILIDFWDITVANCSGTSSEVKPGRVWSYNWALFAINDFGFPERPFNGAFFVCAPDPNAPETSYITKIDFDDSGFRPAAFNVAFNSFGTMNTGDPAIDRQSVEKVNSTIPEYAVFLNDPVDLCDEAVFGSATGPVSLARCGEDDYCFLVQATKAGLFELLIDLDGSGNGIYDEGTEDVLLVYEIGPDDDLTIPSCVSWDGRDALGTVVNGSVLVNSVYVSYIQGEFHFPIYDAEILSQGFEISYVRPLPPGSVSSVPSLYFDDRQLNDGVNDGVNTTAQIIGQDQSELAGCVAPCHGWNNYTGPSDAGFGNLNTINTWWFVNRSDVPFEASIPSYLSCTGINGALEVCNLNGLTASVDTIMGPSEPIPAGITFSWEGPNGFNASGLESGELTAPGTYTFTVQWEDVCQSTCTVEVEDCPCDPNPPTLAIDAIACSGTVIDLATYLPQGVTGVWTEGGAVVTNTTAILLETDCSSGGRGFEGQYVEQVGDCAVVHNVSLGIGIFPAISASPDYGDCSITLDTTCPDLLVSWSTTEGTNGNGSIFTFDQLPLPHAGIVTFEVSDPNSIIDCGTTMYSYDYSCEAVCPTSVSVSDTDPYVCSGDSRSISLAITGEGQDNLLIIWSSSDPELTFTGQGTTEINVELNNDQCAPKQTDFYVTVTCSQDNSELYNGGVGSFTIYANDILSFVSGSSDACSTSVEVPEGCENYISVLPSDNQTANAGDGTGFHLYQVEYTTDASIDIPCNTAEFVEVPYNCPSNCPEFLAINGFQNEACSGEEFMVSVVLTDATEAVDIVLDGPGVTALGGGLFSIINNIDGCDSQAFDYYLTINCPGENSYVVNQSGEEILDMYVGNLNVFPQPNGTLELSSGGCVVSVNEDCDFPVSWNDGTNVGVGNSYTAVPGTTGTVEFEIDGNWCSQTLMADYNCAECPSLHDAVCSPTLICSGGSIDLSVDVINDDDGVITWYDVDSGLAVDPLNLTLTTESCEGEIRSFFASYLPNNSICEVVVSQYTTVYVYPELTGEVVNADCEIDLITCPGFNVSWTSSEGAMGTGTSFVAPPGESGLLTWHINFPSVFAPDLCQLTTIEEPYDCVACPTLGDVECGDPWLCSGEYISLTTTINDDDGGAIYWFNQDDVSIADPSNVLVETTNCEGEVLHFYAVYVPTNTNCPAVTSISTSVFVYPEIVAELSAENCSAALVGYCYNLLISWTDSYGNEGSGPYYEADMGTEGTVDFTLSWPSVFAPEECASQTVIATFDCAACPTIENEMALPESVCSGDIITLSADVLDPDGGQMIWSLSNGTVINPVDFSLQNTSCAPIQETIYVRYEPLASTCSVVQKIAGHVTVYPTNEIELISTDCHVELIPACAGTSSWLDTDGNSGIGMQYEPSPGATGSVTFWHYSYYSSSPAHCYVSSETIDYSCVACPEISSISTSNDMLCSTDFFSLQAVVTNPDGGTLTWYDSNFEQVLDPSMVNRSATGCDPEVFSFYATYNPTNPKCNTVVTGQISVTVWPTPSGIVSGDECTVTLDPNCDHYTVHWQSEDLAGAGNVFDAPEGTSGSVIFFIADDSAPVNCSDLPTITSYDCVACPDIVGPNQTIYDICSGDFPDIDITITNPDGGTLIWYDSFGIEVSDPMDITFENEGCELISYYCYAVYTPANPNCPPVTSTTVTINVHPTITAGVQSLDCIVTLYPECDNFLVTWDDGLGDDDFGATYTADPGTSGTVTFTVTNPSAAAAGLDCATAEFLGSFDCEQCPTLGTASASDPVICSGSTTSLSVTVNDGAEGFLLWHYAEDALVADPENLVLYQGGCSPGNVTVYPVFYPEAGSCGPVVGNDVSITVYPEIDASLYADACHAIILSDCPNYDVVWNDGLGNSGTGDYSADPGVTATVQFTVSADGPCPAESITANISCGGCPVLTNANSADSYLCDGDQTSLSVAISNGDGGTLTWYAAETSVEVDPNNLNLFATGCSEANYSFIAIYEPSNSNCDVVLSEIVSITVYPTVQGQLINGDCSVSIDSDCDWPATWTDSNGGAGLGNSYTANPGDENVAVSFTLYNPDGLAELACYDKTYTNTVSCAACPSFESAVCNPTIVCSGEAITLSADLADADGGTLIWFDENDNVVSNMLAVTTSGCDNDVQYFYAEYTPAGSCITVYSEAVSVLVYPQIEASSHVDDCNASVEFECSSYNVDWTTSTGLSGSGAAFTAPPGMTGTVTFAISNSFAGGSCSSASFTENINCDACPTLGTASASDPIICSGSSTSLSVSVNEEAEGILLWHFAEDALVPNPENLILTHGGCSPSVVTVYPVFYPEQANCDPVIGNDVSITVYPSIDAELYADDCNAGILTDCPNYTINWNDGLGNSGAGIYQAEPGVTTAVHFTVSADGPCPAESFTANISCGGCPVLNNAVCAESELCEGDETYLDVTVSNDDGGVLTWYVAGTAVEVDPNNLDLEANDCSTASYSFVAVYEPSTGSCDVVVSNVVTVDVYPTVQGQLVESDCTVSIESDCDWPAMWTDSNGGSGLGNSYTANPGDENVSVSFTVYNPDGLEELACYDKTYISTVSCAACPSFETAACNPTIVCSGEEITLSASISNGDGGSLIWFDENDNVVSSTHAVTTSGCDNDVQYFYAEYTPAGSCITVYSETVSVLVYPQIEAASQGDDCYASVDFECSNYNVDWTTSTGLSGLGSEFTAPTGMSGTVTFVVSNSFTGGSCSSASFTESINCAACPTLESVEHSGSATACDGEYISLTAELSDDAEGIVNWFDSNGAPVANPNEVQLNSSSCDATTYFFTAVFIPSNSDCPSSTMQTASINVYSDINYQVSNEGCVVSITGVCDDYDVSWEIAGGASGTGATFIAFEGTSGSITFTVENNAAPNDCSTITVSEDFTCDCPAPVFVDHDFETDVCENESYDLNEIAEELGQTGLNWTNGAGDEINNPSNLTTSVSGCDATELTFYSAYETGDTACPTYHTIMITVSVYPGFEDLYLEYSADNCAVDLLEPCSDWTVSWSDNAGNSGDGNWYHVEEGETHTVTFTVVNPNAPQGACYSEEFEAVVDCPEEEPGLIDLELQKISVPGNAPIDELQQFFYYLVVDNTSDYPATGVMIYDNLPSEVTYLSADADEGSYDSAAGTWTIDLVPANTQYVLEILVEVNEGVTGMIYNAAEICGHNETDIDSTPCNDDEDEDDWDEAFFVVEAIDDCEESMEICTAPITPIIICPSFCDLGTDIEITLEESTFNCTIVINDNCVTYMPLPGAEAFGTDSFVIVACNDDGDCGELTVYVTIGNCFNPPIAVDDFASSDGMVVSIDVLENDGHPDGLLFSICDWEDPENGLVDEMDGELMYFPFANFDGIDCFDYTICDANGGEDTATVCVTVEDDNEECENEAISFCNEPMTPIVLCPEFCQFDNTNYSIESISSLYTCSIVQLDPHCFRYTPLPGFFGDEELVITACDEQGNCNEFTYLVFVGDCDGNEVPDAKHDDYELDCSTTTLDVLANDTDPDGDDLIICDFSDPDHGELVFTGDSFEYTANEGATADLFTYTVCDGNGEMDLTNVYITIDCPTEVCEIETVTTCTTPFTEIELCLDPCIANGQITDIHTLFECSINQVSELCFIYIPLPGFAGLEFIEVDVCDDNGNCEIHYFEIFVSDDCDPSDYIEEEELESVPVEEETAEEAIAESNNAINKDDFLDIGSAAIMAGFPLKELELDSNLLLLNSGIISVYSIQGQLVAQENISMNTGWQQNFNANHPELNGVFVFLFIPTNAERMEDYQSGKISLR